VLVLIGVTGLIVFGVLVSWARLTTVTFCAGSFGAEQPPGRCGDSDMGTGGGSGSRELTVTDYSMDRLVLHDPAQDDPTPMCWHQPAVQLIATVSGPRQAGPGRGTLTVRLTGRPVDAPDSTQFALSQTLDASRFATGRGSVDVPFSVALPVELALKRIMWTATIASDPDAGARNATQSAEFGPCAVFINVPMK
jgi:hypothetical protein